MRKNVLSYLTLKKKKPCRLIFESKIVSALDLFRHFKIDR